MQKSTKLPIHLSQEQLVLQIAKLAGERAETRQLAQRLGSLLEDKLHAKIRSKKSLGHSYARAKRLALTDPEYLHAVLECLDFQSLALANKIQLKTHRMLFFARKSKKRLAKTQVKLSPACD